MEIEKEFGLLAAFFKVRHLLEKIGRLGKIPLHRIRTRADDESSGVVGLELQRFVCQFFALRLIAADKRALESGDISFNRVARLAHGLIQIGQPNLKAEIVRFGLQELFKQADCLSLAILLQVDFGQLQEERPSLAHYALLNVEVGKLLQRTNFLGSELSDAFVNGDGFGEEAVANEDLGQALDIIDRLKSLTLADVELADSHQGDLVTGLVLENILVFGDGLG